MRKTPDETACSVEASPQSSDEEESQEEINLFTCYEKFIPDDTLVYCELAIMRNITPT
jgi:hypothetical protein